MSEIIEQELQRQVAMMPRDKSFMGKVLGERDIEEIKHLMGKSDLERSEILKLMYLISSTESKLLNMSEWERYILMKYFVWIREFISIVELYYDAREYYEEREKGGKALSSRSKTLLKLNRKKLEHYAKFLIDLYFNIGRTSLSLGGIGFMQALSQRFEFDYKQPAPMVQEKKGWLRW